MSYGALGGGTFTSMNKVIPGSYINVVSIAKLSTALSERGKAAIPLELDWGIDGIIELGLDDLEKNTTKLIGYSYTATELMYIREAFKHATTLYIGRLNGKGDKAVASITDVDKELKITAKCAGKRGNDIAVTVRVNVDDTDKFDVITYLDAVQKDIQTVSDITELQENDFVTFSGTGIIVTAGIALIGGTNSVVTGDSYSDFLEKIETENFNTLAYMGEDNIIKSLFVSFTKRLRETEGIKIQTVLHDYASDYEGIVSIKNSANLVPWILGIESGCAINKDNTNMLYDGELELSDKFTTAEIKTIKQEGHLVLYADGNDYRVLEDINTLVSNSTEKQQDIFSSNKVMRTVDQIAIDIAIIFNKNHLGKTPNTKSGRNFLKNDIVDHHRQMERLNAIEDFSPDNVIVEIGNNKKSVVVTDVVNVTDVMKCLYMTVQVA